MPVTQSGAILLVVDDDALNRDALSRRLMGKGYQVVTAAGGAEALDVLAARRVDAVLLDVMMPGMSGLETLRRVRESRSAAELPVIMVTAKDESDDVVEALELGANDYITKPIDFAVALARIRAQVASRRADPLTGLPNRTSFMERLERSVARSRASAGSHAVFFLDVDRFKTINDSLGHLAGDELLVGLARRLEGALRSTDVVSRPGADSTVARLGGDEFTILLDGVSSSADASGVAERLLSVMTAPFTVQGREVFATVSIGVALSAPRYDKGETMIRDADSAMYCAKGRGRARFAIFDVGMLQAAEQRIQTECDLRHALAREELRVDYQPIVSVADGGLRGFEALVRWVHPLRGLVLPGEFIAVAEETGLIVPIGGWILREACRQMRRWQVEFDRPDLVINVNLSPRQLRCPELVQEVAATLAEAGLAPECLKLEITEGVMVDGTEDVIRILNELRAIGVQLGLDDFGMGYSALSYLRRFPFQTIKIDRSFISGIHDGGNAEIVRAILSMARGLSMDVTAEGVETAEQLASLRQLTCETAQGYFFHRPLSCEAARGVLVAGRERTPVSAAS